MNIEWHPDSERIKFIIYLMPELSKLKNIGDCEKFLKRAKVRDLKHLKISTNADELSKQFHNIDNIKKYLEKLSYYEIVPLTYILSKVWRKNSSYDKIINNTIWNEKEVPIENIYLQNAEYSVSHIFKENGYKLINIVNDKELWTHNPYNDYTSQRIIEYPICMAEEIDDSEYVIFDGIHRAIQMAYNNYKYIKIYAYRKL